MQAEAKARERGWKMLHQHHDASCLAGHESTAAEIMEQCPGVTDVVCTTGTGSTAAGLRAYLPANVRVHARPAESGVIEGLTDVRKYTNYCSADVIEGYEKCHFDPEIATKHQRELESVYGIVGGASSGAAFWLAKEVLTAAAVAAGAERELGDVMTPNAPPHALGRSSRWTNKTQPQVVFICADGFRKRVPSSAKPLRTSGVQKRRFCSSSTPCRIESNPWAASHARFKDTVVIGGGPVGASAAWLLAEAAEARGDDPKSIALVHDPSDRGAHEDWSRLARLSFDGPPPVVARMRTA